MPAPPLKGLLAAISIMLILPNTRETASPNLCLKYYLRRVPGAPGLLRVGVRCKNEPCLITIVALQLS
jgi:hypothetical protein